MGKVFISCARADGERFAKQLYHDPRAIAEAEVVISFPSVDLSNLRDPAKELLKLGKQSF